MDIRMRFNVLGQNWRAQALRPSEAKWMGDLLICDLAADNEVPLHVIGHLIDHYLGCAGEPDSQWLTEGGGVLVHWREAGARLQRLFALGYGIDQVARSSIREYFAQSLALYCLDRQRLNVADPQICKWFRSTLWNEAFWRCQMPGGGR